MRELRKDPVVGRWVIISTERADRPVDFGFPSPPLREAACPFCPGREEDTPPAVLARPLPRHGTVHAGGTSVGPAT